MYTSAFGTDLMGMICLSCFKFETEWRISTLLIPNACKSNKTVSCAVAYILKETDSSC